MDNMDVKPDMSPPHGLHDTQSRFMSNEYGSSSSAGPESEANTALAMLANSRDSRRERQQFTKDGQPVKRRGPKPDSKPALTAKQAKNRQAQRTHRQRKENYTAALEQDIDRMRIAFTSAIEDKERIQEENRQMRALLAQPGIPFEPSEPSSMSVTEASRVGPSSSGSFSGSYATSPDYGGLSPESSMTPSSSNHYNSSPQPHHQQVQSLSQHPPTGLDYDAMGLDFILNLERPCMDHAQYLMVRAHNPENQFFHHPQENPDDAEYEHECGHSRMLSAIPMKHIMEKPAEMYPAQVPPDMKANMAIILNMAINLPLNKDGEITPVEAWTFLYRHERVMDLDQKDFEDIMTRLLAKVRCYGFGSMLEMWELHDALQVTLANKTVPALTSSFSRQMIAV